VRELVIEQESLRFDYLMTCPSIEVDVFKSLGTILERISGGSNDGDEAALAAQSSIYREISKQLATAEPIDASALSGLFQGAPKEIPTGKTRFTPSTECERRSTSGLPQSRRRHRAIAREQRTPQRPSIQGMSQ
jgi:hypothetical protein